MNGSKKAINLGYWSKMLHSLNTEDICEEILVGNFDTCHQDSDDAQKRNCKQNWMLCINKKNSYYCRV